MTPRFAAEWSTLGARLRIAEPTRGEVRAAAAQLANDYNEPTNRALLTNTTALSAEDVVEMFEGMWRDEGRPFLLYRDGALLGDCDLRHLDGGRAEIAIMVGPREAQGRGFGTRFAVMAHTIAFGPLGLRRVYASVRPENEGSLRMFAKLGYAIDETEAARAYAEASDDVCLSVDRVALDIAQPGAVESVSVVRR